MKEIQRFDHTQQLFRWALWAGLFMALLVFGLQVIAQSPQSKPASDFVEYWAAGRLNASGANPYASDELARLQRQIGYIHNEPMMMWNPPWVMPLVMPFGLIGYPLSRLLWLLVTLALVLFSADQVWHYYGGAPRQKWIGIAVVLTFVPTVFVLLAGQITAFVLLGVVGFLYFERRQQWFWAGVSTLLIAVKPHLLYLFWIALFFWVVHYRRWTVLLGSLVGLAAATLTAIAFNPSIVSAYLGALRTPSYYWVTPTIGANLRLLFGWDNYWLQFVAPVFTAMWFLIYWFRVRENWSWDRQMPIVLLLSVTTTAFGWLFDQVVLLFVPILIVLTGITRPRRFQVLNLLFFVAVNTLAWKVHLAPTLAYEWAAAHGGDLTGDGWGLTAGIWQMSRAWGVWLAPALALWYSWAGKYGLGRDSVLSAGVATSSVESAASVTNPHD